MRIFNIILVLILLHTMMHVQPNLVACRVLNMEKQQLSLQSLDKGPTPPSGPSGCTFVPGSGGTNCLVKEMNVAGEAEHRHAGNTTIHH
ncbi:hypothetical protein RJT34_24247 [Clitoria ternatea]|uniref:Uncharacterized protein n=1 Tax=Clitoria ternatea TaxID=43366 RepID=A0AAN9FQB7_CLITE